MNAVATSLFDEVVVVADDEAIISEIQKAGGKAVKSKRSHESGSDRIAEYAANIEADVIVNIQGDEPFIRKKPLADLLEQFNDPTVRVASLMRKIGSAEAVNPNFVKVVTDRKNNALYFSRHPIPFDRDSNKTQHFLHVGVYAYRKTHLLKFTGWQPTRLELIEKLEQLRYLEHGVTIRMVETDTSSIAIDTPEDLEKARAFLDSYNSGQE